MLAAIACGNAPSTTPAAPPPSAEPGSSTPKASEELPASESLPPGVTPPLPEELAYLATSCKPYVEVYEQTVKRDASLADTLILTPPTLEGVADPTRCAKILSKRVAVSRVREIEREPIAFIAEVAERAQNTKGKCFSAPPVPPELGKLVDGDVPLPAHAFRRSLGWSCLMPPPIEQTHAQYEYRSYPDEHVFEVIARLHPVPKHPATELVIRAKFEDTGDLTVMRRAPTPPLKLTEPPMPSGSVAVFGSAAPSSSSAPGASGKPPSASPHGTTPKGEGGSGKQRPAGSAAPTKPNHPPSDGTTTL